MTGPDSRLTELFQRAGALDGSELARFLAELERDDPRLAGELRELLEFDARRGPLSSEARPEVGASAVGPGSDGFSAEYVKKLAQLSPPAQRYRLEGEVARGGMGAILRVWDESLRRHLAMKVVLGKEDALAKGQTPPVDARTLGRFLEEAQVTGQLDHPGVVPVHELAVNGEGSVYFTMRLVKGASLSEVFALVRDRQEGWNQTRTLSVILKVCETMSYAHSKGVIHRDLKPANVMVGKYGEVYVMDWGLARILGQEDEHDLRLRPASTASIHSERADQRVASPDSPLLTMDGTVMGTPAYMSPEQALGRVEELGPRSDVYGVGAMLYELLAGEMPYVPYGARLSPHVILAMLVQGPPKPVHALDTKVPAELEAICEKAMAREMNARYADMQELADDLRAYLEHRVVHAYETGALAELRKWVVRNKSLAASLAAGLMAVVTGLVVALVLKAQSDSNAVRAAEQSRIAGENLILAETRRVEAERSATEVLRFSVLLRLEGLIASAKRLWPAEPENIPAFEEWIREALELISGPEGDPSRGVDYYSAQLQAVRGRALPRVSDGVWEFAGDEDKRWHAQLEKLVPVIAAISDPTTGLLAEDAVHIEHGWSLPKRLAFARSLQEGFSHEGEYERAWREALPAIHARYPGLELGPQLGLVPIGTDPESGLWEFAHLASGDVAARDDTGKLALTEHTGLVLVLLPGGTLGMGSQGEDPNGPNFVAQPHPNEALHDVTLSPYFLSKYEMTQGQWLRITGENPSQFVAPQYSPRFNRSGRNADLTWPVQTVSWNECMQVCERLVLTLPTEAQWEYATRAGTTTRWWTGEQPDALALAANLQDAFAKKMGAAGACEPWDDGNYLHAPVGSYSGNPFGLHDVHGNVWEWCLDAYAEDFYSRGPSVDPLCDTPNPRERVYRGGSYNSPAIVGRSGFRSFATPKVGGPWLGLRPARPAVRGTPP